MGQDEGNRTGDMRLPETAPTDTPSADVSVPDAADATADAEAAAPEAPVEAAAPPPPQVRPGEHASVFGAVSSPPLILSTRAQGISDDGRAVRTPSARGLAFRQSGRRLRMAISGRRGLIRYLLAALAGVMAGLAMAPFYAVPLLPIAFVTLIWLLDGTDAGGKGRREAFAIGWWFGFPFFLSGLYWIGFSFLVDAETYAWMIPFAMTALPVGLAIFTGLALLLAKVLWRPGPSRILVFALAFAALEMARGTIFTGFPWNLTGYAWGGVMEVMQSVSLFGIYGLTFLTVLTAASPAVLFGHARERSNWRWPGLAIVIIGALWTFGAVRIALAPQGPEAFEEGVNLRIVQPNIPQADKMLPQNDTPIWERLVALSAVENSAEAPVTHVIWPEAAVPFSYLRNPSWQQMATAGMGGDRTLITGMQRVERRAGEADVSFFNSFQIIAPEGQVLGTYDKHHLVPFGEYLPFRDLLEAMGFQQLVQLREPGFRPVSGPGPRTLSVPGAPDLGPLICYEAIFPGQAVDPRRRPGWLVNVTDDSWFGDSTGPRQHLGLAQARAIEEGLPIIRAANTGISAVIDSHGRVLEQLPLNTMGVINSPLPIASSPTIYSILRDWPLLLVFLLGLGWAWARRPRRPAEN